MNFMLQKSPSDRLHEIKKNPQKHTMTQLITQIYKNKTSLLYCKTSYPRVIP